MGYILTHYLFYSDPFFGTFASLNCQKRSVFESTVGTSINNYYFFSYPRKKFQFLACPKNNLYFFAHTKKYQESVACRNLIANLLTYTLLLSSKSRQAIFYEGIVFKFSVRDPLKVFTQLYQNQILNGNKKRVIKQNLV
jgi:hypothetical protein